MKRNKIAMKRAAIATEQGLNLEKDFFELLPWEMTLVGELYKTMNFNGRNNLGRSLWRQFYYHLQKGYQEIKKEVI